MNPNHDPATGQFTSAIQQALTGHSAESTARQEENAALARARGEHLRIGAGRPITPAARLEAERKWARTMPSFPPPAKVRPPRIPRPRRTR